MVAASALSLSSANKASVFFEINSVPPYLFYLNPICFTQVLGQSKLEKKSSIRSWATSFL